MNRLSTALCERISRLGQELKAIVPVQGGRVVADNGMMLTLSGLTAPVGAQLVIADNERQFSAEVAGYRHGSTLAVRFDNLAPVMAGASVRLVAPSRSAVVPRAHRGLVLDGFGQPLGTGEAGGMDSLRLPLDPGLIDPMTRAPVTQAFDCGVRSMNALFTLGRGQRIGLIAGSGVGKSSLLGMITRAADVDVVVVGLIGERGREVEEFLTRKLPAQHRSRAVVVAVPADRSPALRIRGTLLAHALAEHHAASGAHVLLVLDSLTRVAHAQREIGIAAGEPPVARGYPPSVLTLMARLIERCGAWAAGGAISAIYTVLADGDDRDDPVVDSARGLLDGHVFLARRLADRGQFPAIDMAASLSRTMSDVATPTHLSAARAVRTLHATIEESRELLLMGAYQRGADPAIDRALALEADLQALMVQDEYSPVTLAESVAAVEELALASRA